MGKKKIQPERKENPDRSENAIQGVIAGPDKDYWNAFNKLGSVRQNVDVILRTQTPKNQDYNYPWGLFEEVLDLDPHVASVVEVRKTGVTSLPWLVQPGDDSERGAMIAQWCEWWLSEIGQREYFIDGGFKHDRLDLLDAIPLGVSVMEIKWALNSGFLVPERLYHRPLRQFRFGWDDGLRLVTGPGDYEGTLMPERKFLVFTPYTRYENPYGIPALRRVFFYTLFKRTGFRFWSVYLDKFGSPTIIAKHPKNATKTEKDKVYEVIYSYQQETGILIPEDFAFELLEARRAGDASYEAFLDACNREISKGILGQNLTTEVKGGSYAAANVHLQIRADILESDAGLEMDAWNRLFRWAVDLNFAQPRIYPEFVVKTELNNETRTRLEIYRQMIQAKFPLSRRQIREDLHLHAPDSPEDEFIAPSAANAAEGPGISGNPGEGNPGGQSPDMDSPSDGSGA